MPEQVPVREEGRLIEEAALAGLVAPAPPADAAAPVDVPDATLLEGAPAPALEVHVEQQKAEPAPEPRRRIAAPVPARPKTARPTPKPFKNFLGGTRAVPMEEFPFRAGR